MINTYYCSLYDLHKYLVGATSILLYDRMISTYYCLLRFQFY